MATCRLPGACRCERVQFSLGEEPLSFYLCHCTRCQAESGSAFGQSMHVRREAVSLDGGETREHEVAGPDGRVFVLVHCANCLSVVFGVSPELPQIVGLNAGALEDAGGLTPWGNIWTRSARPWAGFAPGPRHAEQPADRLAMVRAWRERPKR